MVNKFLNLSTISQALVLLPVILFLGILLMISPVTKQLVSSLHYAVILDEQSSQPEIDDFLDQLYMNIAIDSTSVEYINDSSVQDLAVKMDILPNDSITNFAISEYVIFRLNEQSSGQTAAAIILEQLISMKQVGKVIDQNDQIEYIELMGNRLIYVIGLFLFIALLGYAISSYLLVKRKRIKEMELVNKQELKLLDWLSIKKNMTAEILKSSTLSFAFAIIFMILLLYSVAIFSGWSITGLDTRAVLLTVVLSGMISLVVPYLFILICNDRAGRMKPIKSS